MLEPVARGKWAIYVTGSLSKPQASQVFDDVQELTDDEYYELSSSTSQPSNPGDIAHFFISVHGIPAYDMKAAESSMAAALCLPSEYQPALTRTGSSSLRVKPLPSLYSFRLGYTSLAGYCAALVHLTGSERSVTFSMWSNKEKSTASYPIRCWADPTFDIGWLSNFPLATPLSKLRPWLLTAMASKTACPPLTPTVASQWGDKTHLILVRFVVKENGKDVQRIRLSLISVLNHQQLSGYLEGMRAANMPFGKAGKVQITITAGNSSARSASVHSAYSQKRTYAK
jgi:hypothetical protein